MVPLKASDAATVDAVADAMRDGAVALVPTDTVYGLACDPRRPAAARRIYALKSRPAELRLPVIVHGVDQARSLRVDWNGAADRLAAAFWPGALTIAVGAGAPGVEWLADRDEIAIRAPADPLIASIAERLGPFLMTSANPHGQGTAPTFEAVVNSLGGAPDVAVDGGARSVTASTVVNVNLPDPRIEREGAIPAADVERVLDE